MVGKILFLAISSRHNASSRLRAWNVADHWPDATAVQWGGNLPDLTEYGTVVVQKLWPTRKDETLSDMPALLRGIKASGRKLIWDLCDPIWWWIPDAKVHLMLDPMDAITVSSPGLRDSLWEDYGIESVVIPDRLPRHESIKEHWDITHPGLIWFGYSHNLQLSLDSGRMALNRLHTDQVKMRLVLIDGDGGQGGEQDENTHVERIKWCREWEDIDLLDGDVAFLPKFPGIAGRMKSNNKDMTAAWAGLPVSNGEDYRYLKKCMTDWKFRAVEGTRMRAWAEANFEIGQSVEQWKDLVGSL